jgi:sugar phosphate isomerase/epimerase
MKLSLSEISTVDATFAEDVPAYAAAGFDAIGIWEFKLPADEAANLALLRAHGLSVANVVPRAPSILQLALPGEWGPDDPEARIEGLCATVRRLAPYEPECVLFLTGPAGDRAPDEARAIVADGIRRIAAAAREVGVRVGLEPVHPTQEALTSFVTSVAAADELLAEAGADDVGVLVDTYHVWDDPDLDAWLTANAARVTGLHVGDWPADPTRTDRELPGEGGGRSREIVGVLRRAGWNGSLDVEVFSTPDGFWGLPVEAAAREAHAAGSSVRGPL